MLKLKNIKKYFPIKRGIIQRTTGWVKAVDDVSLSVEPGTTMGLVGESGCGKTTLGRIALGLLTPDAGSVKVGDQAMFSDGRKTPLRALIQIVFQDPMSSLNPRMTVGAAIAEGALLCGHWKKNETRDRLSILLKQVGLSPDVMRRYPHQFSGGQRQRIGIARALALDPEVIVLDEAVSSLDVSIQAAILNLLKDIQAERGVSYLFISHDLRVVDYMSERIAVMYQGHIVEEAAREALFSDPHDDYTKQLLHSIPR